MNHETNDSQQTVNSQNTLQNDTIVQNRNIPEAVPITSPRNQLPLALTMSEQLVDTEHGQRRIWLQNSLETHSTDSFRDNTVNIDSFMKYLRYLYIFSMANLWISYLYMYYTPFYVLSILLCLGGVYSICKKQQIYFVIYYRTLILQITVRSIAMCINIFTNPKEYFIILSSLGISCDALSITLIINGKLLQYDEQAIPQTLQISQI